MKNSILDVQSKIEKNVLSCDSDDVFFSSNPARNALLQKYTLAEQKIIKEIIVRAEKAGIGASRYILDYVLKKTTFSSDFIISKSKMISSDQAKLIALKDTDNFTYKICLNIIENMSKDMVFKFERSFIDKVSIEIKTKSLFEIQELTGIRTLSWTGVSEAIFYDGIVSDISEIDVLLTKLSETKGKLCIFARSFDQSVIDTIKTNNERGVFTVALFCLPIDIDTSNVFYDIAHITESSVYNVYEKSFLLKSLSKLTNVSYDGNKLSFSFNEKKHKDLLSRLLDEQKSITDDLVIESYKKRVASLSAKTMIVRVPKQMFFAGKLIEDIEFITKTYESLLRSGCFDLGEINLTGSVSLETAMSIVEHGGSLINLMKNTYHLRCE